VEKDPARLLEAALEGARAAGPAAAARIRTAYPFKRKTAAARPGFGPDVLRLADLLFDGVCGARPIADPTDRMLATAALLYLIQPNDLVPDAEVRGLADEAAVIRHVAGALGLVPKPKASGLLGSILARARPASAPVSRAAPPPDPAEIERLAESFVTPEGQAWFASEVGKSKAFAADPAAVLRRLEVSLTSPSSDERHEAAMDLRRLARLDHAHLDRARKRWESMVAHLREEGDRATLRALREAFCEADPPAAVEDATTPEKARAALAADPVRAAALFGRLGHAPGAAEAIRKVLAEYRPVVKLAEWAEDLIAAADLAGSADLRAAVERAALEVVLGRVSADRALGPEAACDDGTPALTAEEAVMAVMGGGPRRTVDARRIERDPVTGRPLPTTAGERPSLDKIARDLDQARAMRQALRPRARRVAAATLQIRGYAEAAAVLWAEVLAEEEGRRRLRAARDAALAADRPDLFETYEKAIAFLSGPPGISTPEE
jgi:hypothetical protein